MSDPAERLEERIQELKAGLVAMTRGESSDLSENDYKETRRLILGSPQLREHAPSWLRTASTSIEADKLLQVEADRRPGERWANRANLIFEGLNPLLARLEDERAEFESSGDLGERLGSGGFGTVYRWTHKLLRRDFAVKILQPSFPRDDGRYIERFFREASILLELSHPNIVRVYDVGMYGRRPYIRMEFLDRQNLESSLGASGPLDSRKAALTLAQVARGLAHAHRQNIVHRDLKPTNIFCSTGDRVCVIDFGLGAFVEEELVSRLTRSGEAVVGGLYTAPELVENRRLLDIRTDVYSAGAVWFKALTGRPPAGSSVHAQIESIQGLTPEYRQVLRRTLADQATRYASADELVAAIEALIITPAISVAPTKPRTEPMPERRLSNLVIVEHRQAGHLVLSLQLKAVTPIPHLQLKVTGLSRWIDEFGDFAPVLAFARSREPWIVARTAGEALLHFDHPAEYQICAIGTSAPSLQMVIGAGRSSCPLLPFGVYRVELVFEGDKRVPYICHIQSGQGTAEFTGDPAISQTPDAT